MKSSKYLLTTLFFSSTLVMAHGGDKPGPHGGHIEMPGAFHTELILNNDQSADVYLIDMNFQNPTVKDSDVSVTIKNKKSKISFKCKAEEDHFHCIPNKTYEIVGEVIVKATRQKAVGNEAVYKLPLK